MAVDHCCDELFTPFSRYSCTASELINCHNCLVKFLSKYFLDITGAHLCSEQALCVAGAFDGDITDTVWFVRCGCRAQPEPALSCNAEEMDTRLWLHVKGSNILIISPDTDIYHVGLPLQCVMEKNVFVQVSPISSRSIQLVNITELINALHHDPDHILPRVIQTLYVVSGCDYISFLSEVGNFPAVLLPAHVIYNRWSTQHHRHLGRHVT